MAELKPAYLISGDDEAKVDAWRSRLRERARNEGNSTLEVLRDERLTGEAVAEAMTALTLSTGRRYVLADGVHRWKSGDVKPVVEALAALPPDTMVVFLATGDPPKGLDKAVQACGGDVREFSGPTTRSYPGWARERAGELGFELDRDASEALVERIPRDEKARPPRLRQQTLMRELEKLSIFAGEGAAVDAETVALLTSSGAEARMFELADAVIEGNRERALDLAERLRTQGEDMMYILFALVRQVRNSYRAWAMVSSGQSVAQVQSRLGVPQFIARKIVSQVKGMDGPRFERALDLLAELDWSVRGGTDRDAESTLTLMLAGAGAAETGRAVG
jgi:DNA polymerase-3 subunit delta